MKSVKNMMLCWNPGTSEVDVVPWPDKIRLSDKYQMSTLACNEHMRKAPRRDRKTYAFIEAMVLIIRDECDPMAVHKALLNLEEYKDGCPDDMPGVGVR